MRIWVAIVVMAASAVALVPPLLVVLLSLCMHLWKGAATVGLTVSFAGVTANESALLALAMAGAAGLASGLWLFAEARKS